MAIWLGVNLSGDGAPPSIEPELPRAIQTVFTKWKNIYVQAR